jgi:hypothetical protein
MVSWDKTSIITVSVISVIVAGMLYWFVLRAESRSITSFLMYATLVILIGFGAFFIYQGVNGDSTQSNNLAPEPVDSSSSTVVPGKNAPPQSGPEGGNYGIQFWMFIKDWDYKFGEEKPVIIRGSNNAFNPKIYLHPTENSLSVKVSVYPRDSSTVGASTPAGVGHSGGSTDDNFVCTVPNVPLQKWTCVGVSVSGRNLDIYMDGLLVRSCLLPGVPKPATGSLQIMPGGGFSGSVIDMYHYSRALVPEDVRKFCSSGTKGTQYNALPSKSIFGYTVKLGVEDDSGKVVREFAF